MNDEQLVLAEVRAMTAEVRALAAEVRAYRAEAANRVAPTPEAAVRRRSSTVTATGRRPGRQSTVAPTKRLYSMKEAAELASISHGTVRRVVASGELGSVKLGRRRLVPAEFLKQYIEGLKTASPAGR